MRTLFLFCLITSSLLLKAQVPTIHLVSPLLGKDSIAYVTEKEVDVVLTVKSGCKIKNVWVNNANAELTSVPHQFKCKVQLITGTNIIKSVAEDIIGRTHQEVFMFNYQPLQPKIEILSISSSVLIEKNKAYRTTAEKPIITLKTDKPSERIKTIILNQQILKVRADGTYQGRVTLENDTSVVLIEVEDKNGLRNQTTIYLYKTRNHPPIISLVSPYLAKKDTSFDAAYRTSAIPLEFKIIDEDTIRSIIFNNDEYLIKNGTFRKSVTPAVGKNTFTLTVKDMYGASSTFRVTTYLRADTTAPTIEFRDMMKIGAKKEVKNKQTIMLEGETYEFKAIIKDNNGLRVVKVNQKVIPLPLNENALIEKIELASKLDTISITAEDSSFNKTTFNIYVKRIEKQPYQAKKAIVIGNANYLKESKLEGPVNDANFVADSLTKLGYNVTLSINVGYKEMDSTIKHFIGELRANDLLFFYYSGHGFQNNDKDYLLPIDYDRKSLKLIQDEAIAVQGIVESLKENELYASILVFDACREQRSKGENQVWTPPNPMNEFDIKIYYAAKSGQKAIDGICSPFTKALLKHLTKGVRLSNLFQRTNATLKDEKRQVPSEDGAVTKDFEL